MVECTNCKRLRGLLSELQKEVQLMHNLIHGTGGYIDRLANKYELIEELEWQVREQANKLPGMKWSS